MATDEGIRQLARDDPMWAVLERVTRVLDADSATLRRQALADGLVTWGSDLIRGVNVLARMAQGLAGEAQFDELRSELRDLISDWIGGASITDRLDEAPRRMAFIESGLPQTPEWALVHANAILSLPKGDGARDVGLAEKLLQQAERHANESGDSGEALTARALRLFHDLVEGDAALAESEALLDAAEHSHADADTRHTVRRAAMQAYLLSGVDAHNRADRKAMQALMARAAELADAYFLEPGEAPVDHSRRKLASMIRVLAGDDAAAIRLLEEARRDSELGADASTFLARQEGRLRIDAGDDRGAIESFAYVLPALVESYVTAVIDEDVDRAGQQLCDAVDALAHVYIRHENWFEAALIVESSKSLRLRYRAGLRRLPSGTQVLALERALWAVSRGLDVPHDVEPILDTYGLGVKLEAKLRLYQGLHALYRAGDGGPRFDRRLPAPKAPGEAVAILGHLSNGFLIAVVHDESTTVSGRWLAVTQEWGDGGLFDTMGKGWDVEIGGGNLGEHARPALSRFISVTDQYLGDSLRDLLGSHSIRRLHIFGHRFLHLVPWWALPSLSEIDVRVAPTEPLATKSFSEPGDAHAVLIASPTGGLRLASVETAVVAERLREAGYDPVILGSGAHEDQVVEHIGKASIAHFACHGIGRSLRADDSALLLAPRAENAEAILQSTSQLAEWHYSDEDDDNSRWAVLPSGFLVVEHADPVLGLIERRVELGPSETIVGQYVDGKLVSFGEAWSAGDIATAEPLASCRMVYLSACASGAASVTSVMDEGGGLPVAFQLAGVPLVVSALWRISDALAVLNADLVYESLLQDEGVVDAAQAVRSATNRLRNMRREEAVARVKDYRRLANGALQRLSLESFARQLHRGGPFPFRDPFDWAAYTVLGSPHISLRRR